MAPKSVKNGEASTERSDWLDAGIQGGVFVLQLVQDAAQYAPVPYLKQAAGSALLIVDTIQGVKSNKQDFQRLADDATALIAAVWRAYQMSSNQKDWPPPELKDVILDLVSTLDSIVKFVQKQVSRNWAIRGIYKTVDVGKIKEYRERLATAVLKFQLSAQLNVNDVLYQVMKKQNEIWDQLEKNGATAGQSGGEKRSATIPQVDDHHRGERSSKDLGDNEEQEDTEAEIARYKAREKAYLQDDSKGSRTKSRRRHWEDQNRLHLNAKGEREGSPGSSHRHSHETTSSQNYAAPPASMTFSNITGAGISVGGGDVRVFNEHSGNKI